MVFAAVDVGSNTLRLLIAEVNNGIVKPLRYERSITRLAWGINETGQINETSARRSAETLQDFAEIIRESGAFKTRCVGTSALREARNSPVLLNIFKEASGLDIEIVSGEEEASLTATGVLSSVKKSDKFAIVDIGGGSTEVIYSVDTDRVGHISEPIGVVKMADAYMKSDPPLNENLASIRTSADMFARKVKTTVADLSESNSELICTAGTATTLAAIDLGLERFDPLAVHNHIVALGTLHKMHEMLIRLPLEKRAMVKGLEPQRADLIIPGIIITISLMENLGFSSAVISNSGLLEGIVLRLAEVQK